MRYQQSSLSRLLTITLMAIKIQLLSISSLVTLDIVKVSSAMAESQGNEGTEYPRLDQLRQFLHSLELTPEQRDVLRAFREKRQESVRIQRRLREKRQKLNTLLRSPEKTSDETLDLLQEVNELMVQMNTTRITNLLHLKENLNPDQVERIVKKIKEWRSSTGTGLLMQSGRNSSDSTSTRDFFKDRRRRLGGARRQWK